MKDERSLLRAARKLDQSALIAIFDKYAPAVYKYILRFYQDPVVSDQLVGKVFTEMLEELSAGQRSQTDLRSFLYQIAYRLVVNRTDSAQNISPSEVIISLPTSTPAGTQMEDPVFIEALLSALHDQLSEDQRHVIVLRFLEDFSLRETAAIIGKSSKDVKLIEKSGTANLRKCLSL